MVDEIEVVVNLTARQVVGVIESLFDSIMTRILMAVRPEHDGYRRFVQLEDFHDVLNGQLATYAELMMILRDHVPDSHPFVAEMRLPGDIWDLIDQIETAEAWSGVPFHETHDDCQVCATLRRSSYYPSIERE